MSRHLSDPRRKFAQRLLSFNTLGIPLVPFCKSTLVLEAAALSKLLEPASQDTVSEPPSGTTIRQIKYSIFHEQQVSLLRCNALRYTWRRWKALPSRPDKSLGAFKSLQEAAEALPGNLRAERSNIIQKRRKLFLDAKVSPFYIGRNSFEGKC